MSETRGTQHGTLGCRLPHTIAIFLKVKCIQVMGEPDGVAYRYGPECFTWAMDSLPMTGVYLKITSDKRRVQGVE
jgi:hypothetical protein